MFREKNNKKLQKFCSPFLIKTVVSVFRTNIVAAVVVVDLKRTIMI